MPIYEYRCTNCGNTDEALCRFEERDFRPACPNCSTPMSLIPSVPAKRTDGIYSYAPNIGDADTFDRRHAEAAERQGRVDEGYYE